MEKVLHASGEICHVVTKTGMRADIAEFFVSRA
jgi:hypothetical protein